MRVLWCLLLIAYLHSNVAGRNSTRKNAESRTKMQDDWIDSKIVTKHYDSNFGINSTSTAKNGASRKRVHEDWIGSKIGTKEYNLELTVISQGKMDYAKSLKKPREGLLCATFIGASNVSVSEILVSNVKIMGNMCDWAIIMYSGSQNDVDTTCEDSRIAHRLIHCQRSPASFGDRFMRSSNGKSLIKLSVPKTVLYQELMPYVGKYKQVFLMDEDISLKGFDISKFLMHWECAFPRKPLIVQPLVFESNQYIKFMNLNSWSHRPQIAASAVGLVEQQVPLMDAVFFEWFVKRVLNLTRETALRHGVDWGHDRSWCNAAAMYSRAVLNYPNNTIPIPCAVFPTAPTIHHLNLRSMAAKRENRARFHANGVKVVQSYIDLFPTWVITDLLAPNDPLDSRNAHKFPKVAKLDRKCVARWTGDDKIS